MYAFTHAINLCLLCNRRRTNAMMMKMMMIMMMMMMNIYVFRVYEFLFQAEAYTNADKGQHTYATISG